jgi:hypothetical protein
MRSTSAAYLRIDGIGMGNDGGLSWRQYERSTTRFAGIHQLVSCAVRQRPAAHLNRNIPNTWYERGIVIASFVQERENAVGNHENI